ncbi:MAG TPA: phage holin family protein [Urbifossiella sp.]|nr:phage holin family protein [Urbifossiella sp.]
MTATEVTPPTLDAAPATQGTVTELVSGIIGDVQKLAQQQFAMLKSEIREDMNRTKKAMVFGGVGVALLTVGGLALVFALVYILRDLAGLPEWGAWMIFAVVCLGAGVALGFVARNLFESFNPLPDKTFNALQENLTWQTQPQA